MKKYLIALALACVLPTVAFAEESCFKAPEIEAKQDALTGNNAGGFDRNGMRDKMHAEDKDPATQLMVCAMGGISMKDNCKCKQDIKKMCIIERKHGKIKKTAKDGASLAWCNVFPDQYWGKK